MISWRCVHFGELTPRELHDILQARAAVFVVEQGCAFQDVDGADPECWHLMGIASDALGPGLRRGDDSRGADHARRIVAYCRLVPPGTKFAEPSIGRVVTLPAARGLGYGKALMTEALAQAARLWPGRALRIGAQRYLERFYGEFGFVTVSEPYDEDGIPHVEMLRAASVVPEKAARTIGQ
jgi:ElaA protein